MRSKTWGLLVSAFVIAGGLGVVFAQVSQNEPVGKDGAIALAAAEPLDIGSVVPIPAGTVFHPYLVGVGEVSGFAAATFAGSVVYSNRLGNGVYAPGGVAGALVGDDFATLVSAGCMLDSLRFRVSGDPLRDGSGVGGYSVQFAFYSGCPSAGGFPLFTPITETLPDNGNYEVVFKPDLATEIPIPINGYFGVEFSRSLAGIVSGALPTAGFSADRFDFPGAKCDAFFGGFPGFDHASFDLEITSRNDCPGGVCSSTCTGGDNDGEFCFRDDCPGATCVPDVACLGGPNNGDACTTDEECPSVCSSGAPSDEPVPCTTDSGCANACQAGTSGGEDCTTDDQCPGSICLIGVCPPASCSRDQCDGGLNNGGTCSVDDCPAGSCDGPTKCDGGTNADQDCIYGCVPSYPAYKNTSQGGPPFTSRPTDKYFADEIILSVPVGLDNPCRLISWEVGFKGQINGTGSVQAELHTFLDIEDPENGGRIAGTKVSGQLSGDVVKIFKKTFGTPILITQDNLYVVYKTSNDLVGAIKTCEEANPGTVRDAYLVHSGEDGATWQVRGFEAGCIAAFEVALSCEGSPPTGACCDMTLTDGRTCIGGTLHGQTCNRDSQCRVCIGGSKDGLRCDQDTDCPGGFCPAEGAAFCVGDTVCRTLPEMNCAHFLWSEGEACGARCDGGALTGQPCTTMFDCPPACVGGALDGEQCLSDGDCPGVCEESSAFAGNSCSTNRECQRTSSDPSLCIDLGTCDDDGVCRGQFCVGGLNSGAPCSRSIDCPDSPSEEGECGSSCMGGDNDGLPCLRTLDCPGGGSCPATPFPEPCGLGTCCTSNDLRCCVTEEECYTEGTPCGILETPLETPVQYRVGLDCAAGNCPRGPCLGQEGDCTQERAGLCVGGTLNGTQCVFNTPCFVDPCCQEGGLCEGNSGCESPSCCTDVCDINISCCSRHWSQTCANISFELPSCRRIPANDTCWDPLPVKGAMFLAVNDSVEIDLSNATGGTSQPGLCCYRQVEFSPPGPGPGSRAEATVWIKTIAPADGTCRGGTDNGLACTDDGGCGGGGKCRSTLSVDTCNTAGGGGDDSIIQVFSVGDLDAGLCEDGSICSIEFQNCVDGFACEFDEEAYCDSLSPIGCSDDVLVAGQCRNSGNTEFPNNSKVCVNVVPGDPYYIMVAAKDSDARGKYRIRTSSFCTVDPPVLFNDACADAEPLGIGGFGCDSAGNCDAFFDLSGNLDNAAAATFDCPGPGCLNTMENDVWYDWTAPATGRVSGDTCDGGNTPDTSLVLYNGCDCPPEFGTELSCSETELDPGCFLGSRVSAPVTGGQCYKFRLGGNFSDPQQGAFPSGNLDINFVECPAGPIDFADPLNDPPLTPAGLAIDGRAPLDPFTNTPRGIDSFTIKWVGGTTDKACYSYCETFVEGFASNDEIFFVTDNGDDTFTVNLARPLAPGAFGTLTVLHGDDTTSQFAVVSFPGDANGDRSVTSPADLDFLIAALNGAGSFDKYRHDMDHSGTLTPADLLRWIDVTSGVPGAFDPWLNAPSPGCVPCCPN